MTNTWHITNITSSTIYTIKRTSKGYVVYQIAGDATGKLLSRPRGLKTFESEPLAVIWASHEPLRIEAGDWARELLDTTKRELRFVSYHKGF